MHQREVVPADRGALTGLLSGIAFVAAIVGAMRLAKDPIPRPGSDPAAIRNYYQESATAARFSAGGQLVSILMLARFTVSVARLASRSRRPRAEALVAWTTGASSAGSLALSAYTHASLTTHRPRTDDQVARLARRVFVVGGPAHGVVYGIFTATAAVAGREAGVLGPITTGAGLATAAAGVASPAYFRWENAGG